MATTTYDTYVYNYPASTAAFPFKVVLPASIAASNATASSATNTTTTATVVTKPADAKVVNAAAPANVTATSVVAGTVAAPTMVDSKVSVTPGVTVDTDIDVSDIDLNPDGSEISVSDMFAGLTTDAEVVVNLDGKEYGYTVIGSGVFDDFMETAYKHLDANFKSNRIKQEDYANAHLQMYLQTLQMMSGQWMQFKMQQAQLKIQAAIESKRLAVQVALANKENEIRIASLNQASALQVGSKNADLKLQATMATVDADLKGDMANQQILAQVAMTNESNKIQVNVANAQAANNIVTTNLQKEVQVALADAQNKLGASEATARTAVQVAVSNSEKSTQVALANADGIRSNNQMVYQGNIQKSMADVKNSLDLESAQEQMESAERQNKARIDAQAELILAQANSEREKRNLYRRQVEGFNEDFKQKMLKIMVDGWSVGLSVAPESFEDAPTMVTKTTIDRIFKDYLLDTTSTASQAQSEFDKVKFTTMSQTTSGVDFVS